MRIGVVGYSSNRCDLNLAEKLLTSAIDELISTNRNPGRIEIVSGLTNIGIPRLAYQLADKRGFVTVGISAEQAFTVHCGIYPVAKQMIHGLRFGDESQVFIDYIDCLARIGGGRQSRNEARMFADKCALLGWLTAERLIERELPIA